MFPAKHQRISLLHLRILTELLLVMGLAMEEYALTIISESINLRLTPNPTGNRITLLRPGHLWRLDSNPCYWLRSRYSFNPQQRHHRVLEARSTISTSISKLDQCCALHRHTLRSGSCLGMPLRSRVNRFWVRDLDIGGVGLFVVYWSPLSCAYNTAMGFDG